MSFDGLDYPVEFGAGLRGDEAGRDGVAALAAARRTRGGRALLEADGQAAIHEPRAPGRDGPAGCDLYADFRRFPHPGSTCACSPARRARFAACWRPGSISCVRVSWTATFALPSRSVRGVARRAGALADRAPAEGGATDRGARRIRRGLRPAGPPGSGWRRARDAPPSRPSALGVSSRRLRILFLLPFTPRPEGRHGGATVTGQLIAELAPRHDVRRCSTRERDEPPGDPELVDACDRSTPSRARTTRNGSGAAGAPAVAAAGRADLGGEVFEPAFASRAVAHAAEWRPDVIQVEYPVMGGYLPALPRDARAARSGRSRCAGAASAWRGAWAGSPARSIGARGDVQAPNPDVQVDAVVVFTERDRAALAELRATAHRSR